jgi:hypothetical protein
MRPVVMLALVFIVVPAWHSQQKPAQLAKLDIYPDFLTAEGVWRPDDLNDKTEIAFDSVLRLECYKHGGKDLVGSDAYCMQATAQIEFGNPAIDVTYYPVLTWSEDKVMAAESSTKPFPVCIWTQITVNLHDHSVMATDTRKLGKGHEGFGNSCESMPLAQTFHLVDKTQELIRRHLRAARINKESK